MNKSFTDRLKSAVNGRDIAPVAKKCGVSEGSFRAYLAGRSKPGLEIIIKIAHGLGVSVGWLAAGEGEPEQGRVAAAIEPGDPAVRARLLDVRHKATIRNAQLRLIVAWMDETYGDDDEQAILLLDDMRRHYPSFERYFQRWAEKKQPGGGGQDTRISCPDQDEKKVEGC
jgi:transcriptional regulator with XRE-family HTH domain